MADLTTTGGAKLFNGAVLPEHAVQTQWQRLQPVLTPAQLRSLYLFGIPLVSNVADPITGRRQALDDTWLQVYIERAVEMAESELRGIYISPVVVQERHPWDTLRYQSMMYLVSKHRPISAVTRLSLQTSDGSFVYDFPAEWIDMAYAQKGQINIIPIVIAQSGQLRGQVTTPASATFLAIFGARTWTPSLLTLEAVAGFPDGLVPVCINDLIGCIAAQEILSQLAATHAQRTSVSIGVDSLSQSVSGPGPQLYKLRMDELTEKRRRSMRQARAFFGTLLFTSDV